MINAYLGISNLNQKATHLKNFKSKGFSAQQFI